MARQFQNPYYADNSKKIIVVDILNDDGTMVTASVSNTPDGEKDNPDWKEIQKVFKSPEIEANTKKVTDGEKANLAVEMAQIKAQQDKHKNEALFAAKVDAFEIEEVSNSKNRTLKAKIRKATNMIEIHAYAAAIILESAQTPEPAPKKVAAKKSTKKT